MLITHDNKQQVVLNDVIKSVLLIFTDIVKKNKISIEVEQLPIIEADLYQMELLFYHLIDNAIKYNRIENDLKIHISAFIHGNIFADIVVTDNGIGISQENFKHIFEIFHRGDNVKKQKGTGIGLALCKMIVENHNGSISVTSVINERSQFLVRLPLSQEKTSHTFLFFK